MFDDSQAESCAACRPRTRLIHPVETLEDARQRFRRNADARIAHLNQMMITAFGERVADAHAAARTIEFDRVVNQVDEDLFQAPAVGKDT